METHACLRTRNAASWSVIWFWTQSRIDRVCWSRSQTWVKWDCSKSSCLECVMCNLIWTLKVKEKKRCGDRAKTQRANSSSYWRLTRQERMKARINRPWGPMGNGFPEVAYSRQTTTTAAIRTLFYLGRDLQYDEVFWWVWLQWKFLAVDNFESISFAGLSVDFCWFDGDGEQASILHFEGPFQSKVWVLDFCLCNEKWIRFFYLTGKTFFYRKKVCFLITWYGGN